ncbi:hypothetical protein PGT21_003109 [Puccinia graminis f. sp. tritici]|uniref:Uncharacterized protein n=1 Tax=Puccinia graminis f. sp. tritici TaxID=56615 RepID=A0A5B0MTG7_PUCGR|nr:hypothetical protein PGT21_003109 [Puccinia graminis f. sp. tritici]
MGQPSRINLQSKQTGHPSNSIDLEQNWFKLPNPLNQVCTRGRLNICQFLGLCDLQISYCASERVSLRRKIHWDIGDTERASK